jgi:hypothetical protein
MAADVSYKALKDHTSVKACKKERESAAVGESYLYSSLHTFK